MLDKQATARNLQPLDQAEPLPVDYQAQEGDYYLVSVYAGRYVVMRYEGLEHAWKYMAEIKTPEAHRMTAPMTHSAKRAGFSSIALLRWPRRNISTRSLSRAVT